MTVLGKAALWYAKNDIPVFPLLTRDKKPFKDTRGFHDATTNIEQVTRWWAANPQANIGIPMGRPSGLVVVDLDPKNGGPDRDTFIEKYGALPETDEVITGTAGRHIYFTIPDGQTVTTQHGAIGLGIDLQAEGAYVVAPPSIHPNGNPYKYDGLDAKKFLLHPAPLPERFIKLAQNGKGPAPPIGDKIPKGKQHDTLVSLAGSMRRRGMGAEAIFAALMETNNLQCEDPGPEENIRRIAESAYKNWQPDPNANAFKGQAANVDAKVGTVESTYLRNETGNADRLYDLHGDDLAHCEQREGFMVWTGSVWRFDKFVLSERMAEATMRASFAEAVTIADSKERDSFLRFVSGSLSRKGLSNMAHLTKKKVRQVETTDFDRDPFLLNCRNGTINLRTGELRAHRKEDLLSKMIPIDYNPAAPCPLFLRFIHRIMGDGPDASEAEQATADRLVAYLQRLFGCAATGKPEKLLVVFYGTGDNGKSTLLETISKALGSGEYSSQVNIESLMVDPKGAGMSNAVNSDLSDLQGSRFVFSSEVEKGQRLALNRVKYLTGLTEIKTRRMRENWIKFQPTWKLFMDCNDRPVISTPTDAIWNRVKCVPFTVKLTKEEIDTDLGFKLEEELPGILAWIVAGARDYAIRKLGTAPAEVEASTEEYRVSSDRLKDFIEDCCHLNPYAWVSSERLSTAYTDWCGKNGERVPLDHKNFFEQIKLKECVPKSREINKKLTRGWMGIEIKS